MKHRPLLYRVGEVAAYVLAAGLGALVVAAVDEAVVLVGLVGWRAHAVACAVNVALSVAVVRWIRSRP